MKSDVNSTVVSILFERFDELNKMLAVAHQMEINELKLLIINVQPDHVVFCPSFLLATPGNLSCM